jgi:adenosylmethionine-8-amino-7-oxononanoate aminotransferase
VGGATAGTVAPVPGYFRKIRQVCDRHGVLLILDEVMCGLGRTGSYHAFEQEGVVPDLLTLAKGLGGGYVPIGAVLAHDRVIGAINAGSGAFQHGYTYVGHPVACAAALAVQRIVLRDKLVARVADMGAQFGAMLAARLERHPHVADIRGRGMFWSVELAEDPGSLRAFAPQRRLHARIKTQARELGLLCYPGGGTIDGKLGDHVLLAPPYLSTADELAFAVDALASAIDLALADDAP